MNDLITIANALHLTPGTISLIVAAVLVLGRVYRSLANGSGLVGAWKNLLYGQNIPKVIATDYKEELKPTPKDSSGSGGMAILILALCLSPFALGLFSGCGTLDPAGVYHGDKPLYVSDRTAPAAYDAIHAFTTFELQHRAELAAHPEIKAAADDIRENAPDWFNKYYQARDLYTAVNTPENLARFNAALDQIKAGVAKATNFLFASQTLVKK